MRRGAHAVADKTKGRLAREPPYYDAGDESVDVSCTISLYPSANSTSPRTSRSPVPAGTALPALLRLNGQAAGELRFPPLEIEQAYAAQDPNVGGPHSPRLLMTFMNLAIPRGLALGTHDCTLSLPSPAVSATVIFSLEEVLSWEALTPEASGVVLGCMHRVFSGQRGDGGRSAALRAWRCRRQASHSESSCTDPQSAGAPGSRAAAHVCWQLMMRLWHGVAAFVSQEELRMLSLSAPSFFGAPIDADLLRLFPPDNHAQKYGSCAVVGSAGHLLGSGLGSWIDSSQVVIRFNEAPTAGFEWHVGSRTTLRIIHASAPIRAYINRNWVGRAGREALVIYPSGADDVVDLRRLLAHNGGEGVWMVRHIPMHTCMRADVRGWMDGGGRGRHAFLQLYMHAHVTARACVYTTTARERGVERQGAVGLTPVERESKK